MKNEVQETIESLRSTHGNFSDRRIPADTVQAIIESSTRAGTASAMQDYSIIVLDDPTVMRELTGYAGSHALVFCADGNRMRMAARACGLRVPGGADAATFLTWCADAFLAAQTACIAARSLGVDSFFTNGIFRKGSEKAFEALGLPDRDCFPLITLVLGYALDPSRRKTERYRGKGLVHHGTYRALSADETLAMIQDYDDPEKRLGMEVDFRAKGCGHYVEWLFGQWLAPSDRGKADPVRERLTESGFY
jgi:nitroreductase